MIIEIKHIGNSNFISITQGPIDFTSTSLNSLNPITTFGSGNRIPESTIIVKTIIQSSNLPKSQKRPDRNFYKGLSKGWLWYAYYQKSVK